MLLYKQLLLMTFGTTLVIISTSHAHTIPAHLTFLAQSTTGNYEILGLRNLGKALGDPSVANFFSYPNVLCVLIPGRTLYLG